MPAAKGAFSQRTGAARGRHSPDVGGGGGANAGVVATDGGAMPSQELSQLLKDLSGQDPHLRQATCKSLGVAKYRGDARVVGALTSRLQDRDQYVRQAAATALGPASRRGDEASISALIGRCTDPDAAVRRVSLSSISQIAQRGCAPAVAAALARLEDRDGGVRRAALKALEKIAEKSDNQVQSALLARTADAEAFVRHVAVEVLSQLAAEGDAAIVARLLQLVGTDRDARVRWASTEALGRLALRGDSRVLTALLARLDDEADSVRRAAANSLGHVTFAPLQELELQERHITEIEFRGAHEVAARDKIIMELEERHALEVATLQRKVDELEGKLRQEINTRDQQIATLEEKTVEQGYLARVNEFIPHAGRVTQFLDMLPSLASPSNYGVEITAPIWALRCASTSGPEPRTSRPSVVRTGSMSPLTGEDAASPDGKDKRWLLSLFELFEQLSSGRVTAQELTENKPLDVYVHRGDDDVWGLYSCNRHRMLALMMRQACSRNELLNVRCVLRPKDDQSFWAWQWSNFYDGGNGLSVNTTSCRMGAAPMGGKERSMSASASATSARLSLTRENCAIATSFRDKTVSTRSLPSTPRCSSGIGSRFQAAHAVGSTVPMSTNIAGTATNAQAVAAAAASAENGAPLPRSNHAGAVSRGTNKPVNAKIANGGAARHEQQHE